MNGNIEFLFSFIQLQIEYSLVIPNLMNLFQNKSKSENFDIINVIHIYTYY